MKRYYSIFVVLAFVGIAHASGISGGSGGAITPATGTDLGGIKGSIWTTCGAAGSGYLMQGWQADGTVLCGPPGAGSLPPDGSKGDVTVSGSWNTLNLTGRTGEVSHVLQGNGIWGTNFARGFTNGDHCGQCHGTFTIRSAVTPANSSWNTTVQQAYFWTTGSGRILNNANTTFRMRMRLAGWMTTGGVLTYRGYWGTPGNADGTGLLWYSFPGTPAARTLQGAIIECEAYFIGTDSQTVGVSCWIVNGSTYLYQWRTMTIDPSLGFKISNTSQWTTLLDRVEFYGGIMEKQKQYQVSYLFRDLMMADDHNRTECDECNNASHRLEQANSRKLKPINSQKKEKA